MRNPLKVLMEASEISHQRRMLSVDVRKAIRGKCPLCQLDLIGHSYATLGQQYVANSGPEYEDRDFEEASLTKSWKESNWVDVVRHCDTAAPAVQAGVMYCPRTKETQALLMIVPFDYVELWTMLASKRLSESDAQQAKGLTDPLEWVPV